MVQRLQNAEPARSVDDAADLVLETLVGFEFVLYLPDRRLVSLRPVQAHRDVRMSLLLARPVDAGSPVWPTGSSRR